jgi:hypothetical protein
MKILEENVIVGELKFFTESYCELSENCDCADPGTGGDDCSCEDH